MDEHGPQATGTRMHSQRAACERGGGGEVLRANFEHDGLEEDLCVRVVRVRSVVKCVGEGGCKHFSGWK